MGIDFGEFPICNPQSAIIRNPKSAMDMRLGLIAGNGRFPFLVLDAARAQGYQVTVVAVKDEAFPGLADAAAREPRAELTWVSLGQLGTCIKVLKAAGVSKAVMAGQVKHVKIFSGILPDLTLLSVLRRLKAKNTDALIAAVADVLAEQGITLIDSTELLKPLLARAGALTARGLTAEEQADLAFGYRMADAIAALDIGQSIAVKDGAVVAVEAMEGTDEMLRRAGQLAGPGIRLVKVAKPGQDMRFDVPVIGVRTIEVLRDIRATALSVDAGTTLLVDGQAVIDAANAAGIAIVGREVAG